MAAKKPASPKKSTGARSTGAKSTARLAGARKATARKATAREAGATKDVATRSEAGRPEPNEYRSDLIAKIVGIAEGLEDDGLELLFEQAKVVEYKGKIEKFNRRLHVAAREAIEARRNAARPDYRVSIERTKDNFFIIQLDDARIFFNLGELREITRICHKAKDEKAAARNLFRWFEQERSDLLADAGVNSNRSPYLAGIYETVVNTYKVKE